MRENSKFKPVKHSLKTDLVPYPARAVELVNIYIIVNDHGISIFLKQVSFLSESCDIW